MTATNLDPRFVQTEELRPAYRVDLRHEYGASDEWRLTGAGDDHELLRWAQAHAAGRAASICAEFAYMERGERTVVPIRLGGSAPDWARRARLSGW
ncbi:hypothetical protein GCM10009715_02630 [Paeniglutamicibacter psychrophenolicus]|uniref:Uncharacterized protein n=1 Tax=Paeniglutamicibacter psychrophenolicus TaxID=257454 RepID=A0ABS4WB91_9MICC|nr:hypothetical protein [Paeniglutamicibacter psychrophenolicus]MBP2373413.1 hypothetical protein [Paeniglutamicibacter psychrophenolicus]